MSALALFLWNAPASGACTFLSSGDWGPVDQYTGTTDCGVVPADTDLTIPSGVTVRVVDDVVLAGSDSQIIVESGGSLEMKALDRQGGPGRIRLAMNSRGILCKPGSSCVFEGAYRQTGVANPTLQDDRTSAGYLVMDTAIPCPGFDSASGQWRSDCGGALVGPDDRPGSPAEEGLFFLPSQSNLEAHVPDSIAAMQPGDVVCFADPNPQTPQAPVDDGSCYEVTDTTADPLGLSPSGLVIDVRQTNPLIPRDTSYPFQLREIRGTSLLAPMQDGDRYAVVSPDALSGIRPRERVGMWLRLSEADGSPEPRGIMISRTWNDPGAGAAPVDCPTGLACDVIEVYDPAGFTGSHPVGAPAWIDYGHGPGDSFFVMTPVVVTDANAGIDLYRGQSFVFNGSVSLRATLLDAAAGVYIGASASSASVRDLWLRDISSDTSGGVANGTELYAYVREGESFDHICMTGGSPVSGPSDQTHALVLRPASLSVDDFTVRDLAIRHPGDDCIGASNQLAVTFDRVRCEWATPAASSANFLDLNPSATTLPIVLRDVLCVDCTNGISLLAPGSAPDVTITGITRWGDVSHFQGGGPHDAIVRDLLSVGGDGQLPYDVEHFVVALADDRASAYDTDAIIDLDQHNVRDGIIRELTRAGTRMVRIPTAGHIENVAIIDADTTKPCTSTPCSLFDLRVTDSTSTIDDVTIGYRPGRSTRFQSGLYAGASSDLRVDGVLVSGLEQSVFGGVGVAGSSSQITATFGATTVGPCLNRVGTLASVPTALPPTTVTLADPIFVDPSHGRFDPLPGGEADLEGCGIRGGDESPGLHTYRWMNAITRTLPESMGDPYSQDPCEADDDGDGDACEPACSDGLDNDGDGGIDSDGGPGGEPADAECLWPWQRHESPTAARCGAGSELALVGALLLLLTRPPRRPLSGGGRGRCGS